MNQDKAPKNPDAITLEVINLMFPEIVAILFLPNLLKKYRTFNYFLRTTRYN